MNILELLTLSLVLLVNLSACQDGPVVTLESLAHQVERIERVREVKDIQRLFSQLAQFGRWGEMASLFSDSGTLEWGESTVIGPTDIEIWLRTEAGHMDGVRPGSLHTPISESPLVSLSPDGLTAKGRWNAMRLMGDGKGGTRIDGGIYENEYTFEGSRCKISLLRYYPLYAGTYADGWENLGMGFRTLGIVPYHFTPETAGVQIPLNKPAVPANSPATPDDLAYRITRLNDEDEVRNLQHTYGYYVDRRMWTDVVDLFATDATVKIGGVLFTDLDGVRQAMETMGPENLTDGVLNDHPVFDTIVEISSEGRSAIGRGIELGMIGDSSKDSSWWKFSVFRNHFAKDPDTNMWKFKSLEITSLIVANYSTGWGNGGSLSLSAITLPAFLNVYGRASQKPPSTFRPDTNSTKDLNELQRRLGRSAAYDATENVSGAYGYYADDIRCENIGSLHAAKGHKLSPGKGWFRGPARIAGTCLASYKVSASYNVTDPNPQRPRIPFHWRPQPVILVSRDGRSSSIRARLFQFGTSNATRGGFSGVTGFNGGMYHDQMVLEDGATGRWKLWSLNIDEFYWQSGSWDGGWANISRRDEDPNLPDLSLKDPGMGARENGFVGGPTAEVAWPKIQDMWFMYRNPVSGRLPSFYWPGCVPCRARPDWALEANGYQEPPTGPMAVTPVAMKSG
jgi:hypothetical protein